MTLDIENIKRLTRVKPNQFEAATSRYYANSIKVVFLSIGMILSVGAQIVIPERIGGVEGHCLPINPSSCQAKGDVNVLYFVLQKSMKQRWHAGTD